MPHFCSRAASAYERTREVQQSPAWLLQGQQRGQESPRDGKGAGTSGGNRGKVLLPLSEPEPWMAVRTVVLSSAIFV